MSKGYGGPVSFKRAALRALIVVAIELPGIIHNMYETPWQANSIIG